MKRFMSVAITIFALSTNLGAATQQPAQFTEADVVALQSTLKELFPEDSPAHNILDHSFQQISDLSAREIDQETFAFEVNRIANDAAKEILQQGIDIEKLKAFAQNPLANRFANALVEKYQMLANRKSIFCRELTTRICFLALECIIVIFIPLIIIKIFDYVSDDDCSIQAILCKGFNPPQSCPCYGVTTTFATATEECKRLALKNFSISEDAVRLAYYCILNRR